MWSAKQTIDTATAQTLASLDTPISVRGCLIIIGLRTTGALLLGNLLTTLLLWAMLTPVARGTIGRGRVHSFGVCCAVLIWVAWMTAGVCRYLYGDPFVLDAAEGWTTQTLLVYVQIIAVLLCVVPMASWLICVIRNGKPFASSGAMTAAQRFAHTAPRIAISLAVLFATSCLGTLAVDGRLQRNIAAAIHCEGRYDAEFLGKPWPDVGPSGSG
jgi:hypothetical protein